MYSNFLFHSVFCTELDSLPSEGRWWTHNNQFCPGGDSVLSNALGSFYSEGVVIHPHRRENEGFGSLNLLQSVRISMKTSYADGSDCHNSLSEATSAIARQSVMGGGACVHKAIDMALYMRKSCRVGFNQFGGFATGVRNCDSPGGYSVSISHLSSSSGAKAENTDESIMLAMLESCSSELLDSSVAPLWRAPIVNFNELGSTEYGTVVNFINSVQQTQVEPPNGNLNSSYSNEAVCKSVKLLSSVLGQEYVNCSSEMSIPVFGKDVVE